MRASDGIGPGFGQAEMPDLAGEDQVLDGSGNIFDRHSWIDPMLIKQINDIGPKPLQRCLRHFAYVLRAAVETRLLAVHDPEAKLGGDRDPTAHRLQRLS